MRIMLLLWKGPFRHMVSVIVSSQRMIIPIVAEIVAMASRVACVQIVLT